MAGLRSSANLQAAEALIQHGGAVELSVSSWAMRWILADPRHLCVPRGACAMS